MLDFDDSNSSSDFLASFSLAGVKAASGAGVLPPGRYACTLKNGKLKATKAGDGSKMFEILCVDDDGAGVITARINLYIKSSPKATEIGREQMRALAEHGGAENPDVPFPNGDESYYNGRQVGVVVKPDTYDGKSTSTVSGFCNYADVAKAPSGPAPKGPELPKFSDSDIPF